MSMSLPLRLPQILLQVPQPAKRRHPHDVPFFMESATQKWAAIFVGLGVVLMLLNGFGFVRDVTPFTQFFLAIGTTFILGASGSDVMRSYRSDTVSQMIDTPQNSGITSLAIGRSPDPKHFSDGSIY